MATNDKLDDKEMELAKHYLEMKRNHLINQLIILLIAAAAFIAGLIIGCLAFSNLNGIQLAQLFGFI